MNIIRMYNTVEDFIIKNKLGGEILSIQQIKDIIKKELFIEPNEEDTDIIIGELAFSAILRPTSMVSQYIVICDW